MPKTLRVLLEYVWTEYDTDQQLNIGTTSGPSALPLGFNNQTNIRLGFDCTAVQNWTFRTGYVWTSQVTPNGIAQPTLEPPAHGNTLTFGAGTTLIADTLDVNGAVEYDWVDGYGNNPAPNAPGFNSGEYTAKGYGLHLGATVRF
jgi:long-chain fatty acid transport protein